MTKRQHPYSPLLREEESITGVSAPYRLRLASGIIAIICFVGVIPFIVIGIMFMVPLISLFAALISLGSLIFGIYNIQKALIQRQQDKEML